MHPRSATDQRAVYSIYLPSSSRLSVFVAMPVVVREATAGLVERSFKQAWSAAAEAAAASNAAAAMSSEHPTLTYTVSGPRTGGHDWDETPSDGRAGQP